MVCGGIVGGSEEAPDPCEKCAKFVSRWDCALALIVLLVEPSLLYLIGDPEKVWKKLSDTLNMG